MVATDSLSLTAVVIVILHVTYSEKKFRSKTHVQENVTTTTLRIAFAYSPQRLLAVGTDYISLLFTAIHTTTRRLIKNIQDRTLRELCSLTHRSSERKYLADTE
jgi:uncharacterized membrane protein